MFQVTNNGYSSGFLIGGRLEFRVKENKDDLDEDFEDDSPRAVCEEVVERVDGVDDVEVDALAGEAAWSLEIPSGRRDKYFDCVFASSSGSTPSETCSSLSSSTVMAPSLSSSLSDSRHPPARPPTA